MKNLLTIACTVLALALVAPPPAEAAIINANWGSAYGMGNPNQDDLGFTGSGAPLAVITSVQSNSVYYITSGQAQGAPVINQIHFKTDTLAATLKFLQATQVFTIASNAVANTNILWIQSTNSGLATNDLLVLEDPTAGTEQLLVLSGNATDAAGLVYTNDAGYNAIKFFTTVTNASVGSKLYKMSPVVSLSPLAINAITNSVSLGQNNTNTALTVSPCGQWLPLNFAPNLPVKFRAPASSPALLVLTYSNAAGLFLEGEYATRIKSRLQ